MRATPPLEKSKLRARESGRRALGLEGKHIVLETRDPEQQEWEQLALAGDHWYGAEQLHVQRRLDLREVDVWEPPRTWGATSKIWREKYPS